MRRLLLLLAIAVCGCRTTSTVAPVCPAGGAEPISEVDPMALEMKTECGTCGSALTASGVAYICSYECTFCEDCTKATEHVCPNCSGELVLRPTRNGEAR